MGNLQLVEIESQITCVFMMPLARKMKEYEERRRSTVTQEIRRGHYRDTPPWFTICAGTETIPYQAWNARRSSVGC